jgi:hypothetical protein
LAELELNVPSMNRSERLANTASGFDTSEDVSACH